jgi:hypothetical protein
MAGHPEEEVHGKGSYSPGIPERQAPTQAIVTHYSAVPRAHRNRES